MYYNKYIKYKTKYINLKNSTFQFGGAPNKVSGPVIIGYFENEELGKKIIVMGDIHGSREGKCISDDISINEYIDTLAKENPEQKYDLFVETYIPEKMQLKENIIDIPLAKSVDYLGDLVDYSYKNYKRIPNMNIHFTDIRNDMNKRKIINVNGTYIKAIPGLLGIMSRVKSSEYLSELLNYDFISDYVDFLITSITIINKLEINDKFKDVSSDLLLKEIQKLHEINPDLYVKLKQIILPYISTDFLNIIFGPENIQNIDGLNRLLWNGVRAGASLQDMYLLARIFKSTEYTNNLIYVGDGHYQTIKNILLKLDFKLIREIKASQNNKRCIEDIIQFNEFFSKPWDNGTSADVQTE